MLKKRIIFALAVCIIAASPLCAANVSFLMIETGRTGDNLSNQYIYMWENSLMDVFFDSGHIVTNSPILRLSQKPSDGFPNEAERDYELAKDGGMDYFIVAIIDYAARRVTLRLFSTNSTLLIREQIYQAGTFRNTKEEQENIKAAIMDMAVHLR